MSHPSKVEFIKNARDAGYVCHLYFVCRESLLINKERVLGRMAKGGHPVDPHKIEQRYYPSLELLPEMIPYTAYTYLFDNSKEARLFVLIKNGKVFDKA